MGMVTERCNPQGLITSSGVARTLIYATTPCEVPDAIAAHHCMTPSPTEGGACVLGWTPPLRTPKPTPTVNKTWVPVTYGNLFGLFGRTRLLGLSGRTGEF